MDTPSFRGQYAFFLVMGVVVIGVPWLVIIAGTTILSPQEVVLLFIGHVVLLAVAWWSMKKEKAWIRPVDEVWDAGDALLVKNKGREEYISLSDIADVSFATPRITLTLHQPGAFGAVIPFIPERGFMVPSERNALAEQLSRRVDDARRRAFINRAQAS